MQVKAGSSVETQCAVQGAMSILFVRLSDALGRYKNTVEDANAIARIVPLPDFVRVLDICCGTGRMSNALSRLGYLVHGVYLSPEQISVATEDNTTATFECRDMALPPSGPFDAIVNIYTSYGYAAGEAEDLEILGRWRQVLRPGGRLIMELADMERAEAVLRPTGYTYRENNGVRERLIVRDRILYVDYEFNGERISCRTRLYRKERLKEMLTASGFCNVQLHGGFALEPKRPSDNLVIVAERP